MCHFHDDASGDIVLRRRDTSRPIASPDEQAPATCVLGAVHHLVCARDEYIEIGPRCAHSRSDRGSDPQIVQLLAQRKLHPLGHPLADLAGLVDMSIHQKNGELFSANAPDDIGCAGFGPKMIRERLEAPIPGLMPVGIVDPLEVIHIRHENHAAASPTFRSCPFKKRTSISERSRLPAGTRSRPVSRDSGTGR